MNKTSLTVFLCSTYSDLSAERAAVLETIKNLQLQHDSMEFFGARPAQPIETCLEEVRRSDVLVVIVGHKYGSLAPGKTISFTEAEYSEGYSLGKPCLVYLRDEDVPILPAHIEREPQKLQSLEKFRALLKARHTVATFRGAGDLAVIVAADLSRTVQSIEAAAREKEDNNNILPSRRSSESPNPTPGVSHPPSPNVAGILPAGDKDRRRDQLPYQGTESLEVSTVNEVPRSAESTRALVHEYIKQVAVKFGAGMGGPWIEAPNLHTVWRRLNQKLSGEEVIALCDILEEVHEVGTYWTAINFLHFSSQQVDETNLLNHILNVVCDHVPKGGHLQAAALQLVQTLELPKEIIWAALLNAMQITKPDQTPAVVDVIMNFVPPTGVKRTGAAIIRVLKFIDPDSYSSGKLIAAIESLDYREAAQPLSEIIMRTNPEAASKIAALFSQWNYKEAASFIRKYVDAKHKTVGQLYFIETLRFLYKIEGPRSCQYIAQVLHNCHPYVQQNLGCGGYLGELANEPVIIEAIKKIHSGTSNPEVKKGLAPFIEKLG